MRSAVLILAFVLAGNLPAAGQEGSKAAQHVMTPEMKQQRDSMTFIDKQWDLTKKAIERGDLKTAGLVVEKIIEEAHYVEKYSAHKNPEKHKQYLEEYNFFWETLIKLKEAISRKDKNITAISISVDESCKRCHNKFR
jgi:cytochrome c556